MSRALEGSERSEQKTISTDAVNSLFLQSAEFDYRQSSRKAHAELAQANKSCIEHGLFPDLQLDLGPDILLAEKAKAQEATRLQSPDLDGIDPSNLRPDQQFGGPVGNWFRHFSRAAWHTGEGLARPNAADDSIFGSVVNAKHYYFEHSPQTIQQDINQIGRDAANWLQHMTPEERSKTSAELAFAYFLLGTETALSKNAAERLQKLTPKELHARGIERRLVPKDALEPTELTPAPGSLSKVESRDWYNAQLAKIDNVEQTMRKEEKTSEEIFDATFALRNGAKRQARDAMKDRVEAARLDRDYPIRTREEILTKYGGDFDKAIAASKRSNPEFNQKIEEMRREQDDKQ